MGKKIRKLRGRKTGHGAKKKHRGAGSRGGRGLAGLGGAKRGWLENYDPKHFSKPSMKSMHSNPKVINLDQINSLVNKNNLKDVNLEGYKVLGRGELKFKVKIKASNFSQSAKEKIERAGGKVEILESKELIKQSEKAE